MPGGCVGAVPKCGQRPDTHRGPAVPDGPGCLDRRTRRGDGGSGGGGHLIFDKDKEEKVKPSSQYFIPGGTVWIM